MLMKAGMKAEHSSLPAVRTATSNDMAVSAFFRYVNEKLTVKAAPAKDKTIRRFPIRTSLAAVLSAVIACTLVISYGAVALRGATGTVPSTVEITEPVEDNTSDLYTTEN